MIKISISIEQDNKDVLVEMKRTDNNKETKDELDCMNDIFDIVEYYVCGDDVENTANEIITTMKNQGIKNDKG